MSLDRCKRACSTQAKCATLSWTLDASGRGGGSCVLSGPRVGLGQACSGASPQSGDVRLKVRLNRFVALFNAPVPKIEDYIADSIVSLPSASRSECEYACLSDSDCINVLTSCNETASGCTLLRGNSFSTSQEYFDPGRQCPADGGEVHAFVDMARFSFSSAPVASICNKQYNERTSTAQRSPIRQDLGDRVEVLGAFDTESKDQCLYLCRAFGGLPQGLQGESKPKCTFVEWSPNGGGFFSDSNRCALLRALPPVGSQTGSGLVGSEVRSGEWADFSSLFDCSFLDQEFITQLVQGWNPKALGFIMEQNKYFVLPEEQYDNFEQDHVIQSVATLEECNDLCYSPFRRPEDGVSLRYFTQGISICRESFLPLDGCAADTLKTVTGCICLDFPNDVTEAFAGVQFGKSMLSGAYQNWGGKPLDTGKHLVYEPVLPKKYIQYENYNLSSHLYIMDGNLQDTFEVENSRIASLVSFCFFVFAFGF